MSINKLIRKEELSYAVEELMLDDYSLSQIEIQMNSLTS